MRRKKLYISVFIVSVLGLFVVQYQFLRVGLNLAKVQFDRKMATAGTDIQDDLNSENQLTFLVAKAITGENYFKLSLDSVEDASRFFLNDFLEQRLVSNGIDTDFSYRLYTRDSTDYLKSPTVFKKDESLIRYPIELKGYLPQSIEKPLILELQFQDLNKYFLSQLNGLTIPALIFIIAIIFVVIWILRSFYWQSNVITTTNEFINNLTHELKTPVFSIGLATKILEDDLDERQKPIVHLIRKQVERLKKHIDQVLDLASLESGKKIFDFKETDLRPILLQLCTDFNMLAKMEDIKFSFELQEGKYPVRAEVSHLENAINNLLDNAKKYSDQPEISLKASLQNKKLVISIKDNGVGISAKEKDQIFKKFYRVPNGNLHKVKGYGLGLSYVKEIVKKHRGTISIESEQNKGTIVSVRIPLLNEKS
ncbi:sensor histidine kinase [Gillisia limnaea]|uniref:histidine kinase n=1 Tax=Gillisia limnaea (strain DSM 15749 / LMG 21470 / R-8282) TaxID=865937 RepID=H2BTC2_GILLR|nr:HAMP domain-containing sensor histidine kinase [Gillisia limnaea]EHQ03721.1 integral membrane sensor signal transduction histidine kinase [Gillisia limnaea DSM 15749]